MNDWLIRNRYGFGAAQVRLAAEPYRANATQWSLREGARYALTEFERGNRRGGLALAPILALGLVVLLAPAIAMFPLRSDRLEIDMLVLESARLEPPLAANPPAPSLPAQAEPRRALPPKPKPTVATPKPVPPPAPIAKPPPPEAAPPKPRIIPEPPPLAIAKAPTQRAPESLRVKAAPRSEPKRPVVNVAPLASAPRAPKAEFTPARSRRTPIQAAAAAPPQPVARIDAVAAPERGRIATATSRREVPILPPASRARSSRASMPSIPRIANEAAPSKRVSTVAQATRRTSPSAPPIRSERRRSDSPELAGVPLAALASCVSDREEDQLKQRVLAKLGSRAECASAAGRYVFVEARNLNAFLMYVERAPSRKTADRCTELSLAIDCLAQSRGKEMGRL